MILKRAAAFLIDVTLLAVSTLIVEFIACAIILTYSHKTSFGDDSATILLILVMPICFALFETGIIFSNTPGRKIFNIKVFYKAHSRLKLFLLSLARSTCFFYLPLILLSLLSADSTDVIRLRSLLSIYSCLLIPISVISSNGFSSLHDVIFHTYVGNANAEVVPVNSNNYIKKTFYITTIVSLILFAGSNMAYEYAAPLLKTIYEQHYPVMTTEIEEVIHNKPPNLSKKVSYENSIARSFSIKVGQDTDLNKLFGISNVFRKDIIAVNVNMKSIENNDTITPREAEVEIYMPYESYHNFFKRDAISKQLYYNFRDEFSSLQILHIEFYRPFEFDMAVVGEGELLEFKRDIQNGLIPSDGKGLNLIKIRLNFSTI